LARNRCEYDQHAKDKLIRDLKADSGVSGAKDMMRAGKPLTLQEFMESYEGHVRGRKTASGKKDSKPAITGPAASEFEVEDEEVTEKVEENLNADLTDQLVKNKPEAPGKSSGTALATTGGSEAGVDDRDDSDEGECDSGDSSKAQEEPVPSEYCHEYDPDSTIGYGSRYLQPMLEEHGLHSWTRNSLIDRVQSCAM